MHSAVHKISALSAALLAVASSLAANSVNWLPASDAVWSRAATEAKPVFLHIASPASGLSQAMDEQTFANPESAALLNKAFLCVRVDADTDPAATENARALLLHAGAPANLPFNVWLTPEGRPLEHYGYLPPSSEWGRESFNVTAQRVSDSWIQNPDGARATAADRLASLQQPPAPPASANALQARLDEIAASWTSTANTTDGTFGEPPFTLEPEAWAFLLARGGPARDAALACVTRLLASPMRDPSGCLRRRAAEPAWQHPSDDAHALDQLRCADLLLRASVATGDKRWANEATQLLDATLRLFARDDHLLRQAAFYPENATAPRRIDCVRLGDNAFAAAVLVRSAALTGNATHAAKARQLFDALACFRRGPDWLSSPGGNNPAGARDLAWVIAASHALGTPSPEANAQLVRCFDSAQGRWLAAPLDTPHWWPLRIPLPAALAADDFPTEAVILLSPEAFPASTVTAARTALTQLLLASPTPSGPALVPLIP
ncbi:DUF255 domain-containing protein [Nibricoccus sp. IMCC34717]|uniref:DUF255 domain-containing protein n=1 Tax=Nibricoccus sp. IMCC34717 TaxID=3034021 RepID=UPI00385073C7